MKRHELTDDIYDASFNVVDVDLTINNISVSPAALFAGEQMTVSWEGSNQTGMPLLGD